MPHTRSVGRGVQDTNIASELAVFKSLAMLFNAFLILRELSISKDRSARALRVTGHKFSKNRRIKPGSSFGHENCRKLLSND